MQYGISMLLGAGLAALVLVLCAGSLDEAEIAPVSATETSEGPERVEPPMEARPVPADCDTLQDAQDELVAEAERLEEAVQLAELGARMAEEELEAVAGTPQPWPDDLSGVPEAFRPDRFEATVEAWLQDHPEYALEATDCSENPCIAGLKPTGEGDEASSAMGLMMQMGRAYDERFRGVRSSSFYGYGPDGAESIELYSVLPADMDAGMDKRVKVRLDRFKDALLEAVR